MHVDDDLETARREAAGHLSGQYRLPLEAVERWTALGSIERVLAYLHEHVAAGVQELVLMPLGSDPLRQYERLAEAQLTPARRDPSRRQAADEMSYKRRPDDPVVTGIGALTPLGHSAPETWRGLVEGRSGVGPVTSFDASALPVRIAGEVHGFDAERELGTKRARRSARFTQLAVVAAREAVADAGFDATDNPDRTGVLINDAVVGMPETELNIRAVARAGCAT